MESERGARSKLFGPREKLRLWSPNMPRSNFGFCCWREPLAWSLWYVSRFRSLVKANPSNFWVGWSYYLLYSTDIISIKSAVSWMDQHIATANNVFIVYRWLPFAEWHRRARCIISLTLRVYLSFIYMTPFASLLLQLVYRNIQMSVSPKERGKRQKMWSATQPLEYCVRFIF